ncbi:Serine/threonine-protein kinase env7 [Elasticomyces elasticus]|nr:Serine/threonine-protein kinase env7 [Elasticomyces elasticus]
MSQPSLVTQLSHYVLDTIWQLSQCCSCFPSNPSLRINGRSFKILRLLGEGGFSYVYLVQSPGDPTLYALKKIRCPFGQESVEQALKEVEAYSLFSPHPNIIHAIDHSVEGERGDESNKTVYILLPYYRRGNLQDAINANLVNHSKFPERRLMVLFLGVCKALKAMHQYRAKGPPGGERSRKKAKKVRMEAEEADEDAEQKAIAANTSRRRRDREQDEEDAEQEPLVDNSLAAAENDTADAAGSYKPCYAHRDIKPGNIMIDDDSTQPILMDLGSLAPAPTPITSRAMALQVQDQAAEHSTMPYRAPELFDVKTDTVVDTKVDIWSLGCTLYACLVGKSPFEARSEETGGSLSLCVLGGDWRFPDEGPAEAKRGKQRVTDEPAKAKAEDVISEPVKEIVRACLKVEPGERPDIDQLSAMVEDVIARLPDDGDTLEDLDRDTDALRSFGRVTPLRWAMKHAVRDSAFTASWCTGVDYAVEFAGVESVAGVVIIAQGPCAGVATARHDGESADVPIEQRLADVSHLEGQKLALAVQFVKLVEDAGLVDLERRALASVGVVEFEGYCAFCEGQGELGEENQSGSDEGKESWVHGVMSRGVENVLTLRASRCVSKRTMQLLCATTEQCDACIGAKTASSCHIRSTTCIGQAV